MYVQGTCMCTYMRTPLDEEGVVTGACMCKPLDACQVKAAIADMQARHEAIEQARALERNKTKTLLRHMRDAAQACACVCVCVCVCV